MNDNPDKADAQAIRQAFQQLRETNRRLSEFGWVAIVAKKPVPVGNYQAWEWRGDGDGI